MQWFQRDEARRRDERRDERREERRDEERERRSPPRADAKKLIKMPFIGNCLRLPTYNKDATFHRGQTTSIR